MRFLMATWMIVASWTMVFAQEDISVLVLKSGQEFPIEGEIEILMDEVQFRMDGNIMVMPLDKVDLEATEKRNQELAEALAQSGGVSQSGGSQTLADQVEAWKASGGEVKPPEIIISQNEIEDKRKASNDSFSLEDFQAMLDAAAQGDYDPINQFVEQLPKNLLFVVLGAFILMGVFSVVSFFTQIYVMFTAFGYSSGMGTALLVTWLGPFFLSLIGGIAGIPALVFVAYGLSILYPILMIIHIAKDRYGSRLKLAALVFILPIIMSALAFGTLFWLAYSVAA
jgi:hypothetical protein